MKTASNRLLSLNSPATGRHIHPGGSIILLALLCGCATREPVGLLPIGGPPSTPTTLDPGIVAIACPAMPADTRVSGATGRTRYRCDGAGDAARACLDPPGLNNPGLKLETGPVGFALSPFAAAYGALSAGHARLSPDQLSDSVSNLVQVMGQMAEQRHLRDEIVRAATEVAYRHLLPLEPATQLNLHPESVSAVIEARVEELRLERLGSSDTSFALLMKTRVRLVRVSDGAVLVDRPFEYRTGTALWLDWTYPDTFRGVAMTAYRELARAIAREVFSDPPAGPVLVGAGYKVPSGRTSRSIPVLADNQRVWPASVPTREAACRLVNLGPISIYSTAENPVPTLQQPLTKEEAVSEAIHDVEWSLDGLQDSENSVVRFSAYAAAIPLSLSKQTVGLIRGLTEKQYREADAQLAAAARQSRPHEDLAYQVAQQLTPRTSQPVLLAKGPPPDRGNGGPELIQCAMRTTPDLQTVNGYPDTQGTDTTLTIQVLSAALKGGDGVNPSLAVCVDAQATLLRSRDGAELYCCPVHYRSGKHTFTEWAQGDARLFRQELQKCYREISAAMVEDICARQLRVPDPAPQPTLAKTH